MVLVDGGSRMMKIIVMLSRMTAIAPFPETNRRLEFVPMDDGDKKNNFIGDINLVMGAEAIQSSKLTLGKQYTLELSERKAKRIGKA